MGNPWGCAGAAGISCKMKNHTSNICCLLKHLNVLDLKQELIASHLHCCVNYCHDMLLVLRHSSGTNGFLLCRCIALFLPNGWNKRTSIGIDQWAFTHNFANGSIKWEYIPVHIALSNDHMHDMHHIKRTNTTSCLAKLGTNRKGISAWQCLLQMKLMNFNANVPR